MISRVNNDCMQVGKQAFIQLLTQSLSASTILPASLDVNDN